MQLRVWAVSAPKRQLVRVVLICSRHCTPEGSLNIFRISFFFFFFCCSLSRVQRLGVNLGACSAQHAVPEMRDI